MIKIRDITNSKFITTFLKAADSNIVAKIIVILIFWGIALCPVYLYLFVNWIASPDTFWQSFAIIVIFLVTIGWLQAILAFIAFILMVTVILGS